MKQAELKTAADVLQFMNEHIKYGWQDVNGHIHHDDMNNFRRDFRIAKREDCLEYGFGTCIEQVYLMHTLLDQLHIPNKMFCCRIYEPDEYGNLEEDEHMHCFLLYYEHDHVYHLEYPHTKRAGIYEYQDEASACQAIEAFYIELRGGVASPTTQFYEVTSGLTFQEFNAYINQVERTNKNLRQEQASF